MSSTSSFELSSSNLRSNNARKLEDNNDYNADGEYEITDQLTNYAIKFQGCHWQSVWNAEWDGADDESPVIVQRVVRFKLCPVDECIDYQAQGCSGDLSGEYFMDMNTYVQSEYLYHEEQKEYWCALAEEACENGGDCSVPDYCDDEDAEADYDVNGNEKIDIADYLECEELDIEEDAGYNYQAEYDENGDAVALFLGPRCSEQGGSVTMGLYQDEDCSIESLQDFESIFGYALEYSASGSSNSLVSYGCMSCKESAVEENNDNDEEDEDEVVEFCETVYEMSGRCEKENMLNEDQTFCDYINGIKILRSDGMYEVQVLEKGSSTAGILVGLFALGSIGLAAYIHHLRKSTRGTINLS